MGKIKYMSLEELRKNSRAKSKKWYEENRERKKAYARDRYWQMKAEEKAD